MIFQLYITGILIYHARALTTLSSAAGSTDNLELIRVVKELLLPRSVNSEQQMPKDGNGVHVCVRLCVRACVGCQGTQSVNQ